MASLLRSSLQSASLLGLSLHFTLLIHPCSCLASLLGPSQRLASLLCPPFLRLPHGSSAHPPCSRSTLSGRTPRESTTWGRPPTHLGLQPGETPYPEDLSRALDVLGEGAAAAVLHEGRRGIHLVGGARAPREGLGDALGGHGRDKLSPDQGATAKEHTPQPLVQGQGLRLEKHATVLHYYHLQMAGTGESPRRSQR